MSFYFQSVDIPYNETQTVSIMDILRATGVYVTDAEPRRHINQGAIKVAGIAIWKHHQTVDLTFPVLVRVGKRYSFAVQMKGNEE